MSQEKDDECGLGDVMSIGPEMPDGSRPAVRHDGDHNVRYGVVKPMKEGSNVEGEIVRLNPREDGQFDVESLYKPERSGPSMVNTNLFRSGWDSTFGKSKEKSAEGGKSLN